MAIALRTKMPMTSVTTWTLVSENSTPVACATREIYEVDADIPAGDCDCDGNQLDALEVAVIVLRRRCGRDL